MAPTRDRPGTVKGTEPVLRLSVEADSPRKAGELLQWLRD
jgi:hypothetical protein